MQLSTLQDVYAHPGPYVTVHLDVSRDTEDAPQQLDARWTSARHTLEKEGVDPSLIEQIGQRLQEPTDLPGEVRRTIIAAGNEIVFDDVSFAYRTASGHKVALQDVDLTIHAGQTVALVGETGAGKTTTVRILATLLKPDAGRATVAGYDIARQSQQLPSPLLPLRPAQGGAQPARGDPPALSARTLENDAYSQRLIPLTASTQRTASPSRRGGSLHRC